jgi:hypothetical protein
MSGSDGDATRVTSLDDILGLQLEAPVLATTVPVYAAPAPPFLSLKEAAAFLGTPLSTLNRLLGKRLVCRV